MPEHTTTILCGRTERQMALTQVLYGWEAFDHATRCSRCHTDEPPECPAQPRIRRAVTPACRIDGRTCRDRTPQMRRNVPATVGRSVSWYLPVAHLTGYREGETKR